MAQAVAMSSGRPERVPIGVSPTMPVRDCFLVGITQVAMGTDASRVLLDPALRHRRSEVVFRSSTFPRQVLPSTLHPHFAPRLPQSGRVDGCGCRETSGAKDPPLGDSSVAAEKGYEVLLTLRTTVWMASDASRFSRGAERA
jgi:hypothetical protein